MPKTQSPVKRGTLSLADRIKARTKDLKLPFLAPLTSEQVQELIGVCKAYDNHELNGMGLETLAKHVTEELGAVITRSNLKTLINRVQRGEV